MKRALPCTATPGGPHDLLSTAPAKASAADWATVELLAGAAAILGERWSKLEKEAVNGKVRGRTAGAPSAEVAERSRFGDSEGARAACVGILVLWSEESPRRCGDAMPGCKPRWAVPSNSSVLLVCDLGC